MEYELYLHQFIWPIGSMEGVFYTPQIWPTDVVKCQSQEMAFFAGRGITSRQDMGSAYSKTYWQSVKTFFKKSIFFL